LDTWASAAPVEVGDTASAAAQGRSWPLTPGSSLGQIIRPRHDGLCAIEFLLSVGSGFAGTVTCHLQDCAGTALGRASLVGASLADNRFARFVVPPVPDSAGRALYVWLETDAPGLGIYTCGAHGTDGARREHAPIATSLVYRTFAAGADARWADRRTIEHLLVAQADLTRELLAARLQIRRLSDERTVVERRLQRLVEQVSAPLAEAGHG
jgi:hypothetical protein